MDRLTIRTLYGAEFKGLPPYTNKPEKNKLLSEAAERLAAYEDSGLTPEQIEALKQANEQLQAQVAQYRDAVAVLETVTEHLENCYGRNTPDTEKAREVLAAIDKIGGREDER
jgi:prophage DNA circulation protein